MSVEVEVVYDGNLMCTADHGPSGATLRTEAPVDNGGNGTLFSPTDLLGASLGTCLLTIMGKLADRHGWDLRGTRVRVVKEMSPTPPRRIAALKVNIALAQTREWSSEDLVRLRNAAETCPVKQSLHPDIQTPLEFVQS